MLKRPYQSQEKAIASYNYEDIAEGTGVISFYGCKTETSGATVYKLVQNAIYSSAPVYAGNSATLTFDLTPFNIPKQIKGTAMFSAGVGGNSGVDNHISVQVYHYDGTTATAISSELLTASHDFGTLSGYYMVCIPIPLTETRFNIGDNLRLVVKLTNDVGSQGEIGVDPKGSESVSTWIPANKTIMQLDVPFKIDL